jgi:hypothetical protein
VTTKAKEEGKYTGRKLVAGIAKRRRADGGGLVGCHVKYGLSRAGRREEEKKTGKEKGAYSRSAMRKNKT